ncbi:MAG: TatD family hydrolase [Saprospiraceae bacterium]|nr:TatD family hydrolase [Saprospiraceae bacterium]
MESFINIHTHHIPTHDVDVWTNVNLQQDANTFLQPNSLDRNKGKTTFSVGIHPWYLDAENYLHQIDQVSLLLKEVNCIAIGEADWIKDRNKLGATKRSIYSPNRII